MEEFKSLHNKPERMSNIMDYSLSNTNIEIKSQSIPEKNSNENSKNHESTEPTSIENKISKNKNDSKSNVIENFKIKNTSKCCLHDTISKKRIPKPKIKKRFGLPNSNKHLYKDTKNKKLKQNQLSVVLPQLLLSLIDEKKLMKKYQNIKLSEIINFSALNYSFPNKIKKDSRYFSKANKKNYYTNSSSNYYREKIINDSSSNIASKDRNTKTKISLENSLSIIDSICHDNNINRSSSDDYSRNKTEINKVNLKKISDSAPKNYFQAKQVNDSISYETPSENIGNNWKTKTKYQNPDSSSKKYINQNKRISILSKVKQGFSDNRKKIYRKFRNLKPKLDLNNFLCYNNKYYYTSSSNSDERKRNLAFYNKMINTNKEEKENFNKYDFIQNHHTNLNSEDFGYDVYNKKTRKRQKEPKKNYFNKKKKNSIDNADNADTGEDNKYCVYKVQKYFTNDNIRNNINNVINLNNNKYKININSGSGSSNNNQNSNQDSNQNSNQDSNQNSNKDSNQNSNNDNASNEKHVNNYKSKEIIINNNETVKVTNLNDPKTKLTLEKRIQFENKYQKVISVITSQKGSRKMQNLLPSLCNEELVFLYEDVSLLSFNHHIILYYTILQIEDEYVSCFIDDYGNYFCQQLYSYLTIEFKKKILKLIVNNLHVICSSSKGLCALVCILENNLSTEEQTEFMRLIKPNFESLIVNQSHIRVFEAIVGNFDKNLIKHIEEFIVLNIYYFIKLKKGFFLLKKMVSTMNEKIFSKLIRSIGKRFFAFTSLKSGSVLTLQILERMAEFSNKTKSASYIKTPPHLTYSSIRDSTSSSIDDTYLITLLRNIKKEFLKCCFNKYSNLVLQRLLKFEYFKRLFISISLKSISLFFYQKISSSSNNNTNTDSNESPLHLINNNTFKDEYYNASDEKEIQGKKNKKKKFVKDNSKKESYNENSNSNKVSNSNNNSNNTNKNANSNNNTHTQSNELTKNSTINASNNNNTQNTNSNSISNENSNSLSNNNNDKKNKNMISEEKANSEAKDNSNNTNNTKKIKEKQSDNRSISQKSRDKPSSMQLKNLQKTILYLLMINSKGIYLLQYALEQFSLNLRIKLFNGINFVFTKLDKNLQESWIDTLNIVHKNILHNEEKLYISKRAISCDNSENSNNSSLIINRNKKKIKKEANKKFKKEEKTENKNINKNNNNIRFDAGVEGKPKLVDKIYPKDNKLHDIYNIPEISANEKNDHSLSVHHNIIRNSNCCNNFNSNKPTNPFIRSINDQDFEINRNNYNDLNDISSFMPRNEEHISKAVNIVNKSENFKCNNIQKTNNNNINNISFSNNFYNMNKETNTRNQIQKDKHKKYILVENDTYTNNTIINNNYKPKERNLYDKYNSNNDSNNNRLLYNNITSINSFNKEENEDAYDYNIKSSYFYDDIISKNLPYNFNSFKKSNESKFLPIRLNNNEMKEINNVINISHNNISNNNTNNPFNKGNCNTSNINDNMLYFANEILDNNNCNHSIPIYNKQGFNNNISHNTKNATYRNKDLSMFDVDDGNTNYYEDIKLSNNNLYNNINNKIMGNNPYMSINKNNINNFNSINRNNNIGYSNNIDRNKIAKYEYDQNSGNNNSNINKINLLNCKNYNNITNDVISNNNQLHEVDYQVSQKYNSINNNHVNVFNNEEDSWDINKTRFIMPLKQNNNYNAIFNLPNNTSCNNNNSNNKTNNLLHPSQRYDVQKPNNNISDYKLNNLQETNYVNSKKNINHKERINSNEHIINKLLGRTNKTNFHINNCADNFYMNSYNNDNNNLSVEMQNKNININKNNSNFITAASNNTNKSNIHINQINCRNNNALNKNYNENKQMMSNNKNINQNKMIYNNNTTNLPTNFAIPNTNYNSYYNNHPNNNNSIGNNRINNNMNTLQ